LLISFFLSSFSCLERKHLKTSGTLSEDLVDQKRVDNLRSSLYVVGCVHVADLWDRIDKILGREARHTWLNPNDSFKDFIQYVNMVRSSSQHQPLVNHNPLIFSQRPYVIINGDLVDYYYADYHLCPRCPDKTKDDNWSIFYNILDILQVPSFSNVGNHEFRSEAYNLDIYGLDHVGISRDRLSVVTQNLGFNQFRGLDELDSVTFDFEHFDPFQKYRGNVSSHFEQIGPFATIFLNTGSDSFVQMQSLKKQVEKVYWSATFKDNPLLLSPSAAFKGISVDAFGLSPTDIKLVADTLKTSNQNTIYIFMHAPLLNQKERDFIVGNGFSLDLNNFLKSQAQQRLGIDSIINGGGDLLKVLVNSDKNIIIVASHTHNPQYYVFDKGDKSDQKSFSVEVRAVSLKEINALKDDPQHIKHITYWPLGAIDNINRRYGFLIIHNDGFIEVSRQLKPWLNEPNQKNRWQTANVKM